MTLSPIPAPDTRMYFRPAAEKLVELLRSLDERDWNLPTAAGTWRVRDVVAHMIDTAFRRLSLERDRHAWGPSTPIASEADLVGFINRVNREWVDVSARLSPRALIDLYAMAGEQLSAFFESRRLDGPARLAVSWAGEVESPAWFDIGREFTEVWHHQMQIRDAVDAPLSDRPEWLRAVLQIAVRALPHAYRHTTAAPGTTVVLDVSGPSGGCWTLERGEDRWTIQEGRAGVRAARAAMPDEVAWRLLFNAIPPPRANALLTAEGELELLQPLVNARAVIV